MSARYPLYVNVATRRAIAENQAASARHTEWLQNAITDGPLPIHEPRPPSLFGDLQDGDPSVSVLRAAQQALAAANLSRTLLTFANRHDTEWSPCPYPSHRTSRYEIYTQPSGFRNLHESSLPRCPHYSNPGRTEYECTMRPRTHRYGGETFVVLHVPDGHECSFYAVVRPRERRPLYPDTVKQEVKEADEAGPIPFTPPSLKRNPRLKSEAPLQRDVKRFQPTAKAQALGRATRLPQRQKALALISGSSTAGSSHSLSAIPPHVVINVDGDDDISPPPYTTSPPRRHRSGLGTHLRDGYTKEEAQLNLAGDPVLMELTVTHRQQLANTKEYTQSFWLLDGPNGPRFCDPQFPARLRPYCSDGSMTSQIVLASPVGPDALSKFTFALATTDGVSGAAYDTFFNMLRVCLGCGGHFTPYALNAHLVIDGNNHRCGNHPLRPIVSPVSSVPYGDLLAPRPFALGRHPTQPPLAPYREFGMLTALGIALSALNTKFGLPDDIFTAVRLGLVPCIDCARFRTVHAHVAHRPGDRCHDVGPTDSSFISISTNTMAAIGPNGDRRILTIPEV